MASSDLAFEVVESGSAEGMQIIGREIFDGSKLSAYSFMIFNLLCAPCFAAMGAIKREMNSPKWTAAALGYMTAFAYAISLIVYNVGMYITDGVFTASTVAAFIAILGFVYFIFRKNKYNKPSSQTASQKGA